MPDTVLPKPDPQAFDALMRAQAEALHAKRFPSLRMSGEEHARRVKSVLDALTPVDRVWVEPAIDVTVGTASGQAARR